MKIVLGKILEREVFVDILFRLWYGGSNLYIAEVVGFVGQDGLTV